MSHSAPLSRNETARKLRIFADSLNEKLESDSDRADRSAKGQFTTPSEAATSLVELLDLRALEHYRIADPGAGSGSLMLSIVALVIEKEITARLTIDLIEYDELALRLLEEAVSCARQAAVSQELELELNIIAADFLDLASWKQGRYDVVVANPPYNKLAQDQSSRELTRRHVGVDCPNAYAAFVATAISLLVEGGQLVAITPRSFANGRYFLPFRLFLTESTNFVHVLLFDRRDRIFRSSSVLQETVIFRVDKASVRESSQVTVETRLDHESPAHEMHVVPQSSICSPDDPDRFINLPGNSEVMAVASRLRSYPESFASLGMSVSTGPVVDFRLKEFLTTHESPKAVPLIYPVNVRAGMVSWPIKGNKAQGFVATSKSERHLYPNGYYVLVKRFTSKEEKKRVVAAVYEPIAGYELVAFENHLNVIHVDKLPMPQEMAEAISGYLNSEEVDIYFRMFSGNTQVNATDLRKLRIPFMQSNDRRPVADPEEEDLRQR